AELVDKYAPQQQVADNKKNATNKISADAQRMLAQARTAVNSADARQKAANDIASNTTPEANASTTSEADIAAQLALAALVAENPELAAYFVANPGASTEVLNGNLRVEDILAEIGTITAPMPPSETEVGSGPTPAPVTVEKF